MNVSARSGEVLRSSLRTSMLRYRRSWGLWLLLLIAPVGARLMISDESGRGVVIAVQDQLPVLTSAMLGVWLGIVVTTLLLPVGYIYLRANTNRRQPWQVEEVTAAPRIAMLLGRFAADCVVLLGSLCTLTLAGWFLGWLMVTGPFSPWYIAYPLWLIAAPPLIMLAALRILFDALPWLRGALGDLAYFFLWMASIVMPLLGANQPSSFTANLFDHPGFVRPLAGPEPAGEMNVQIGGVDPASLKPGRIDLDVGAGLHAPGYIAARLAWIGIAVAIVLIGGLMYRPHRVGRRKAGHGWIAKLLSAGPPPAARLDAPAARLAGSPALGLVLAEFRLIGAGRLFLLLAVAVALMGLGGDYRHMGSPASLLLLIFGLCAHAGRSEARGLLKLVVTTSLSPMMRRAAFVLAGTGWALLLALPAAAARGSGEPLLLALATGGAASIAAMMLATLTGSSFAPRVVLLIAWYVYLSS
ncbi:hypothetical protein [Blastomonas sp. AAP53]|uniref:hypothetical protein n=1 Tax=Blastomonas sp. AAP53 TaxID=1248760 RepID=UPI0002EB732B|nr:hypothetical protein [Blastomonas sp. AAP53]